METETLIPWLREKMREMFEAGVWLDPLLVNVCAGGSANLSGDSVRLGARRWADDLYERLVRVDEVCSLLGDVPYSPRIMRTCLHQVILSTVVALEHDEYGLARLSDRSLQRAVQRVEEFIARAGVHWAYAVYLAVVGHDVLQPLAVRRDFYEADYLEGIYHYPYPSEELDVFLMLGLAMSLFRFKVDKRQRRMTLTRQGRHHYQWLHRLLSESGYLHRRMSLSYVHQFEHPATWVQLASEVWPDVRKVHREFVRWLSIPRGARVLEVAFDLGPLAVDGGIRSQVGPAGQVVVVDVSGGGHGLLHFKELADGAASELTVESGSVDRLPCADASFDICVGTTLLHAVDPVAFLREMSRVVKRGGVVAVLQPVQYDLFLPFLKEWFEPVFDLSKRRTPNAKWLGLPAEDEVRSWFVAAGLEDVEIERTTGVWRFNNPEMVVQHFFRGIRPFQAELMELPWNHWRSLLDELIERGADVCRRYPLAERTVSVPLMMVRGRRGPARGSAGDDAKILADCPGGTLTGVHCATR